MAALIRLGAAKMPASTAARQKEFAMPEEAVKALASAMESKEPLHIACSRNPTCFFIALPLSA